MSSHISVAFVADDACGADAACAAADAGVAAVAGAIRARGFREAAIAASSAPFIVFAATLEVSIHRS